MVLPLGIKISLMRLFGGDVVAYAPRFPVHGYACAPFILEAYDTHKTRFVSPVRFTDVLRISIWHHYAKVINSVIMLIAVYVIYQTVRPFAVRKQPGKPMRFVNFTFIPYRDVNAGVSRKIASLHGFGNAADPRKRACACVVAQNILKVVKSKFAHASYIYPEVTGSQA